MKIKTVLVLSIFSVSSIECYSTTSDFDDSEYFRHRPALHESDPDLIADLADIRRHSGSFDSRSFTTSESSMSSRSSESGSTNGFHYLREFNDIDISQVEDIYRGMDQDQYYRINEEMLQLAKTVSNSAVFNPRKDFYLWLYHLVITGQVHVLEDLFLADFLEKTVNNPEFWASYYETLVQKHEAIQGKLAETQTNKKIRNFLWRKSAKQSPNETVQLQKELDKINQAVGDLNIKLAIHNYISPFLEEYLEQQSENPFLYQ